MRESDCKAALCKILRAALPWGRVFRHEDSFTGGIPDISINSEGRTLWVEVKLDRPGRRGKLTALQGASLHALCGILLTYQVDKAGLLGASRRTYFTDGPGPDIQIAVPRKNKAEVHGLVANDLLDLLYEVPI